MRIYFLFILSFEYMRNEEAKTEVVRVYVHTASVFFMDFSEALHLPLLL